DVRVVCATHRRLEDLVEAGAFREDLYYRLKGVEIVLPPLRDRREDIPLLADHFLQACINKSDLPPKLIDDTAMAALIDHDWPGNVRQLQQTVESLALLVESGVIVADDVSKALNSQPQPDSADTHTGSLAERTRAFRRKVIIETLARTGHNVSAAARILEMDSSNLSKLMNDLEIPRG
ncbi:hypothetical protein GF420_01510, partial [candidate division GN15 bacterium]|nr:hypothetical protein [candidate division GN15 bacterium]